MTPLRDIPFIEIEIDRDRPLRSFRLGGGGTRLSLSTVGQKPTRGEERNWMLRCGNLTSEIDTVNNPPESRPPQWGIKSSKINLES